MADVITLTNTDDPNQSLDQLWRVIAEIHNEAKSLFLFCEEVEPNEFRSYLQPYNELRHAYEHAIRAKINQIGLDGIVDEDYQRSSLNKTLGHEYRAFFDCADWLAVILRESIQTILSSYPVTCINTVLPDYYKILRPKIIEITESIARVRGDKDISKKEDPNKNIQEVHKYKQILEELRTIENRIQATIPDLQKHKSELRSGLIKKTIIAVICGIVIAIGGFLFGKFYDSFKNPTFQQDKPTADQGKIPRQKIP